MESGNGKSGCLESDPVVSELGTGVRLLRCIGKTAESERDILFLHIYDICERRMFYFEKES